MDKKTYGKLSTDTTTILTVIGVELGKKEKKDQRDDEYLELRDIYEELRKIKNAFKARTK